MGRTEYAYNENGSLISEQTEGREEVTYEYTVEQRLTAIREGGALLMAASYDGDGNRVFQISRTESVHYVEKGDVSDAVQTPTSPISDSVGTARSIQRSGNGEGECIRVSESDLAHIPGVGETGSDSAAAQQANVHTYYERVYADPADSIFWYGFGQGMLQFFGNLNSALSAYLSDWFCHLWDFVTGQYELVVHSVAVTTTYSGDDVENLRELGLSESEMADITGGSVDATGDVATENASIEAADGKATASTTQSLDQTTGGDTIVIPEEPTEKERVDYELTYYVNDVNTGNTQVLMEYGKRDEKCGRDL